MVQPDRLQHGTAGSSTARYGRTAFTIKLPQVSHLEETMESLKVKIRDMTKELASIGNGGAETAKGEEGDEEGDDRYG